MDKDIIYREDAIKAVCSGCLEENNTCRHGWDCPMLTNLGKLPSTDRLQGEWVEDPINKDIRQCSNCKISYTKDFLKGMTLYAEPKEVPNFCPNCGARMKGADDE